MSISKYQKSGWGTTAEGGPVFIGGGRCWGKGISNINGFPPWTLKKSSLSFYWKEGTGICQASCHSLLGGSGALGVVLVASTDTRCRCGTHEAAPSQHPHPPSTQSHRLPPLSPSSGLHSWSGHRDHGSFTGSAPRAQRIPAVAKCCHRLGGVWKFFFSPATPHSLTIWEGGAGKVVHLDIILKLKLKGYPYVLLFTAWRSWDHVFIFFVSFPFPSPTPEPSRVPHTQRTQPATYPNSDFIAAGDRGGSLPQNSLCTLLRTI